MKYPIGIQSFEKIRNEGYVYVDKTRLVYEMVHNSSICFLSRPRRFGKSLLVSMLECYFRGRKELFNGLAMESLEKEWKQYPVFHLDFNGKNFTKAGDLEATLQTQVECFEAEYGRSPFAITLGDRFAYVLKTAHERTGLRAVVLVDEYDKPLLDVLGMDLKVMVDGAERQMEEWHRQVLKGFYGVFKMADDHLHFVLLTGVTKFSQVSVFSDLNQLDDISMDERYDALCGMTEKEVCRVFQSSLHEMSQKFSLSDASMLQRLKRKYDGYHFSQSLLDVFNPFSILSAFRKMQLADFWFRTGSPTYLVRLLSHSKVQLNDLTGRYYPASHFMDYNAEVPTPLPMLYQSGYLTIKDYDPLTDSYLLDFPNDEVRNGLLTIAATNYLKPQEDAAAWVIRVVKALDMGNTELLRDLFASFLASIPYNQRRKSNEREKERYFQYTFYLILRMLSSFTVLVEREQSEGRVDCIVETDAHVYVIEFKLDGNAESALRQIEEKGYARPYAADLRQVHLIGCSFSSKTGTIDDWADC